MHEKGTPRSHNVMHYVQGLISQSHSTNKCCRLEPTRTRSYEFDSSTLKPEFTITKLKMMLRYSIWKLLVVVIVGNKISTELLTVNRSLCQQKQPSLTKLNLT